MIIRKVSGSFSFIMSLVILLSALSIAGYFWTPHNPTKIDILQKLQPASLTHIFGTDHFGRDIFSMILKGMGASLFMAISAVLLGAVIGSSLGFCAAFFKYQWLDIILSRIHETLFVFPTLIIALLLVSLYGPSIANAIIAVAVFNIPMFFKMARSIALSLLDRDYIRSAIALGRTPFGLFRYHILPNSAGLLVVQFSLQVALALLAEASLSYLGLGVPAPQPSLGRMLQDAQTYLMVAPQLALFPGVTLALIVLLFQLLGDELQKKLDPKQS